MASNGNPAWVKGMESPNKEGRPPKDSRYKLKKVKEILEDLQLNPAEELAKLAQDATVAKKDKIAILNILLEWSQSKPVKETLNTNMNVNSTRDEYLQSLSTEELIKLIAEVKPKPE